MIKQNIYKIVLKVLRLLGLEHYIPDELYLRMLFYRVFGKKLNLDNPKTYNEKLQWMKLNYRPAILSKLVDKNEVKFFVANKIGKEYVIPTLGVWKSVNDIDFNSLPDQFVLKCTHDSGGIAIIKDKAKMKKETIKKQLSAAQKRNHFWSGREWPYKDVVPRIIAEPYLEDKTTHELSDYKFFPKFRSTLV